MTNVRVLVPVLGRPQRAHPVAQSIRESDDRASILFLCSPGDDAEISAVKATGEPYLVAEWPNGPGDYARKLNHGFRLSVDDYEWIFLAADDLVFWPGWFDSCLMKQKRDGGDCICVVGTNDLGNSRVMAGNHSTHTLVHRDYLECGTIDEDGKILHEGYTHQFVDDEFIQTAQARRTYAHAHDARVEHLHPNWRKGADDETYRIGNVGFQQDRILFERRKRLWEPLWRYRR